MINNESQYENYQNINFGDVDLDQEEQTFINMLINNNDKLQKLIN